jgi:hypothetical protein
MTRSGENSLSGQAPRKGAPASGDMAPEHEGQRVRVSRHDGREARPSGDGPKRQGDRLSGVAREATREPLIEDEP